PQPPCRRLTERSLNLKPRHHYPPSLSHIAGPTRPGRPLSPPPPDGSSTPAAALPASCRYQWEPLHQRLARRGESKNWMSRRANTAALSPLPRRRCSRKKCVMRRSPCVSPLAPRSRHDDATHPPHLSWVYHAKASTTIVQDVADWAQISGASSAPPATATTTSHPVPFPLHSDPAYITGGRCRTPTNITAYSV
ncbi:hypothetical protein B0H14DRAFT_1166522, partial [Mycena olivaceomarginata]